MIFLWYLIIYLDDCLEIAFVLHVAFLKLIL